MVSIYPAIAYAPRDSYFLNVRLQKGVGSLAMVSSIYGLSVPNPRSYGTFPYLLLTTHCAVA